MFLAWRTQLREAQNACNLGRLDEAAQRLADHKLRQYKPGEALAHELAQAYIQRSLRRNDDGNFSAAWHDLQQARQIVGQSEAWLKAHLLHERAALLSIDALLSRQRFADALQQLETLAGKSLPADVVRESQTAVRHMESAQQLLRRGKFPEAQEQLALAAALRPEWQSIAQCRDRLGPLQVQVREQSDALHQALLAQRWHEALKLAEGLLEVAPDYRLAREARQKAWQQAGANMADSRPHPETQYWPQAVVQSALGALAQSKQALGTRFLLWVDAVGGYLVCLADEIWIGQASIGNPVAVPILGELSRKHAKLTRRSGCYVLEAAHEVAIDGKPVTGSWALKDGEEIELGRSVRLRFRQPHPLSATARLEMLSRHRTQPGCDAIILMDQTCVMGPNWQNHVVCRDWSQEVILFRQGDELFCRTAEPFQIDGVSCVGRGALRPNSQVQGNDFSFALELVK